MTSGLRPMLERLDPRHSWVGFLTASVAVLVALLWLVRPDVSADRGAVPRALFWVTHVALPIGLAQLAQLWVQRRQRLADWPIWAQVGLAAALAAVMFAPLALWLDQLFALVDDSDDHAPSFGAALLGELSGFGPALILVWGALNGARLLRLPDPPSGTAPSAPPAPPAQDLRAFALGGAQEAGTPQPEFWDRVPAELGRDLVALSAELHYLRVYTARGEALVLAGFGRAVEQVSQSAIRGLQVHRSHWVALDHVQHVRRRGQAAQVELSTGVVLPVSRAQKAALSNAL